MRQHNNINDNTDFSPKGYNGYKALDHKPGNNKQVYKYMP